MFEIFQVLGGMALFLFGVDKLSEGMEKLAGNQIQVWLDRMTNQAHQRGGLWRGSDGFDSEQQFVDGDDDRPDQRQLDVAGAGGWRDDGAGDWHDADCPDRGV